MSSPAAQLGQGLPCSPWGWKPHCSDSALGRRERKTSLQGKQMAKTKLGVRWASCLLGKALAGRKQHGITSSLCPNPVSTHREWDMQLSGEDTYCTLQQCRICLVLHVCFQHAVSFHLELTLFQYFLLLFKGSAAIHLPLRVQSPGPCHLPGHVSARAPAWHMALAITPGERWLFNVHLSWSLLLLIHPCCWGLVQLLH